MKKALKCTGITAAVLAVFIFLNTLSGLIPVSAMKQNLASSADYYMGLVQDSTTFINHVEGYNQTSEHVYADAILMDMIASFDSGDFWGSTLRNPYYYDGLSSSSSLFHATNGAENNRLYSRYWHGTLMFTRLELLFTDAQGIHVVNAVFLGLVLLAFLAVCWKKGRRRLAVTYLIAFILTASFFDFWTIEYMSCPTISMMAGMALLLVPDDWLRDWRVYLLFSLTGMTTAFFDFFTNETMTYILPAVCLVLRMMDSEDCTFKKTVLAALKTGCVWLGAWAVTFALRWVVSILTPGAQTLDDILSRGVNWAVGSSENALPQGMVATALWKNLSYLFPAKTPLGVFGGAGAALLVMAAVFFIFRSEDKRAWLPAVTLLILMLIPYVRYAVMAKHSFGHSRFTFRAQISSITCALLFLTAAIRPPRRAVSERKKTE